MSLQTDATSSVLRSESVPPRAQFALVPSPLLTTRRSSPSLHKVTHVDAAVLGAGGCSSATSPAPPLQTDLPHMTVPAAVSSSPLLPQFVSKVNPDWCVLACRSHACTEGFEEEVTVSESYLPLLFPW